MTIDDINGLAADEFVTRFGHLFEHSPWVVSGAEAKRPFASVDGMLAACEASVAEADEAQRLALLRAHPELAGKAAMDRTLTQASEAEQASAGLDRLTPTEFDLFHARNSAYATRFGIPFIICVRLTDKAGIFAAMNARLANDRDTEIATAFSEVFKIARLRLEEMLA